MSRIRRFAVMAFASLPGSSVLARRAGDASGEVVARQSTATGGIGEGSRQKGWGLSALRGCRFVLTRRPRGHTWDAGQ